MPLRRRTLLGTAGALAASAPMSAARAADTLTVAAYGGEYRDIFIRTVITPFEQKFSCKVEYDDSGGVDPYPRIRASQGSPGFDVAAEMVPSTIILGAKEKLLEPITETEVPNMKYLWSGAAKLMPPYGIAQNYQYLALVWNKEKLARPESWLDYWQAGAKYGDGIKGHLVSHSPANYTLAVYAMMMGARANGGTIANLDPVWPLLTAQKPLVGLVAASSAQAVPYMENGQVWLMPFWSGRSALYAHRGLPYGVTIPKEGTLALANTSAVPIGATNKRLAFAFLNFRLEPEIQRAFCLEYFASPGRMDITGWPEDYAALQLTTDAKMQAVSFPDDALLAQQQRAWTLRWQEVMGA